MIVKEASYLFLQRRCLLQIPDCSGAVEELPLELRGNSIPAHKHGRAQALQNLLFFFSEGSTVEMNRHPFFVFGKRRVGLLEIEEFPRFVRRTRCVGEGRPEFGCFGSVLLRSEHLTRPFYGRREHNGSPPAGAVGCTDSLILNAYGNDRANSRDQQLNYDRFRRPTRHANWRAALHQEGAPRLIFRPAIVLYVRDPTSSIQGKQRLVRELPKKRRRTEVSVSLQWQPWCRRQCCSPRTTGHGHELP